MADLMTNGGGLTPVYNVGENDGFGTGTDC